MNFTKLFNIIFLLSLLMFLPVVKSPISLDLIPFQNQDVIVNVQGQSILLTTNSPQPVGLSVYYMSNSDNKLIEIVDVFFNDDFTIDVPLDQQGNFLFKLNSTTLTKISIDVQGIPLTTFGIVGIIFILRYLVYLRNRFTLTLEY